MVSLVKDTNNYSLVFNDELRVNYDPMCLSYLSSQLQLAHSHVRAPCFSPTGPS